ncbi:MAG: phosphoribosylaminoimidazolesuccinocarboxamide synthase [Phycisphaerae bacterium]
MNATSTVTRTEFPNLVHRGKVRDLYDLGDKLLLVTSDRISAFDVVMKEPIPGKGVVLTKITEHWLHTLQACKPHHLEYVVSPERVPEGYESHVDQLVGRAMVAKKTRVLPVECVVRGYLIGGGWKEYQETGAVSGISLPSGMRQAQKLDTPLFTPSTKAEVGHDEPISFDRACDIAAEFALSLGASREQGRSWMTEARERSLAIYLEAREIASKHGIIIADTKFEFGVLNGKLLLIDEVLTPDSSRFWPQESWKLDSSPPSFDKQYLRDYLNSLDWNKQPPPPTLPAHVIAQTSARYQEAMRVLIEGA